jgi:hypothetical protein
MENMYKDKYHAFYSQESKAYEIALNGEIVSDGYPSWDCANKIVALANGGHVFFDMLGDVIFIKDPHNPTDEDYAAVCNAFGSTNDDAPEDTDKEETKELVVNKESDLPVVISSTPCPPTSFIFEKQEQTHVSTGTEG